MQGTELDTIADLLRRWQRVEGPMDRVRVVTDATEALRNLSSMDTRVLAQGLWEHGAGPAAEQVAHRAGTSVAPEELAEVAQQVLNLDHREVERFADELRDPDERRRLLSNSGVSPEQMPTHLPERPPSGEPLDLPPPPQASEPTAPSDPDGETTNQRRPDSEPTTPSGPDGEPTDQRRPGRDRIDPSTAVDEAQASHEDPRSTADAGRSDDQPTEVPVPREVAGNSIEVASGSPSDAEGSPPRDAPSPYSAGRTVIGRSSAPFDTSGGLAKALRAAPNGRQRLLHLESDAVVVHGSEVLRILRAVPDGWQRRTVLRKLLAAGQVRSLDDPTAVVTAFGRDGDRFAVAAALVRAGLADVASVLPPLRQRHADRLRRRVT